MGDENETLELILEKLQQGLAEVTAEEIAIEIVSGDDLALLNNVENISINIDHILGEVRVKNKVAAIEAILQLEMDLSEFIGFITESINNLQ